MKTICGRGNSEPSRLMEQTTAGDEGDAERRKRKEKQITQQIPGRNNK